MGGKALLLVDVESIYIYSEEYLGNIREECWNAVRGELFIRLLQISDLVNVYEKKGYEIHFTGQGKPHESLEGLIQVTVPYWLDNMNFIHNFYSRYDEVILGGLFMERCVYSVSKIIRGSKIIPELCVSHEIVGDSPEYNIDYPYVDRFVEEKISMSKSTMF